VIIDRASADREVLAMAQLRQSHLASFLARFATSHLVYIGGKIAQLPVDSPAD